jgi:hypothetical protein
MTGNIPDDDEEVRALMRVDPLRTSAAHDAAVLAAAREHSSRSPVKSARRRMFLPFALAASLAVVTVGLYLKYGLPLPDDGTVRSGNGAETAAVVPASGLTLDAFPNELHWPAQPGARSYRVVLRDAPGEPIWRSAAVAGAHTAVDVTVRESATRTYYWTVEVDSAGGVRELGPFWFRMR